MVEFDRHLWWSRAWDRRQRSLGREDTDASLVNEKWTREAMGVSQLETLIEWCTRKGLRVVFGRKVAAVLDQNTKTITVSGRLPPDRQVHVILHECGHFLVGNNPRFVNGYPYALDPKANRSFEHRLACLEEEIEAWNRGWNLGVRLGLSVDPVQFERTRAECLRSYVNWTSRK